MASSNARSHKKISLLAKACGALFALFIVIVIFALRPVDYTPYFETEYYRNTRARLSKLAATRALRSHGSLFIGLGRASLTPRLHNSIQVPGSFERLPLAGYGKRLGRTAEGVHDSLFASAIALRVGEKEVVLVNIDALIVSRAMAEGVIAQVDSALGLKREQVLFGATHTHSGFGAWGEGVLAELFAGEYNPKALQWIIQQMVAAIQRAHADLSPASFAHGDFAAPRYVANRLVGEKGGVDEQFSYLIFRQADGEHAILGAYAAHATVLTHNSMQLSADYCGYWRAAIEKALENPEHFVIPPLRRVSLSINIVVGQHPPNPPEGGNFEMPFARKHRGMAVFFAGGVGSHSPRGEGEEFERARFIGEGLADNLLIRIPKLVFKSEATLGYLGLKVDLPELHMRATDQWRLAPWIAKQLVYEHDSYLQLIALEDLLWLGAPCDISGEIALTMKDFAQRRGYQALLTSFNGSYLGYVIPGRYYHYDSYESRRMSFFGPYMGDYLEEMMRRMMVTMMEPR